MGLAALVLLGLPGCGDSGGGTAPGSGDEPAGSTVAGSTAAPATEQTDAAPAPPSADPCALVSKQDAERLAGTPLDDAVPARETCTYSGPVTGPTAQVEVYVGDGAKKILDIDRELEHEIWPLSGIADEAYAEDGAVFVNKSGQWVAIRLVSLNDPKESRKPLEDLARKVAGANLSVGRGGR
jgi:hypothetical protein